MLGEISGTEKDIPHDLTYMWYLKIIMKAYMKVVKRVDLKSSHHRG